MRLTIIHRSPYVSMRECTIIFCLKLPIIHLCANNFQVGRLQNMEWKEQEFISTAQEIESKSDLAEKKVYSLIPDIMTGWKPRHIKISPPILIRYEESLTRQLLYYYRHLKEKVIYLGPQYSNSYDFHEQCPHEYALRHGIKSEEIPYIFSAELKKYTHENKRPFKGMNPTLKGQLEFDSNFESGNLDLVIKQNAFEYNLFLRPDTNTRGHMQWFYFKVRNDQLPQNQEKRPIKFNICNNRKYRTLYQRGLKPYVRSKHLQKTQNIGWHQAGEAVTYKKMVLREQTEINEAKEEFTVDSSNSYICLSFEYEFVSQNDEVEFAYCPPFTYSDMRNHLNKLKKDYFKVEPSEQIIKQQKLCISLSGVEVPILTITDPGVPQEEKKVVVTMARIHPGESNGSYVMKGFLDFITSHAAKKLREKVIFIAVPMINPDGVIFGNNRTSLSGKDLNRQFRTKKVDLFPEIIHLKSYICRLRAEKKIKMPYFLDFHGHSVKKNAFCYGPEYDIWSGKYEKAKLLPHILALRTDMFRYRSCLFRVAPTKKTTARAFMLCHIPFCYTVESSIGLYCSRQNETIQFNIESWKDLGKVIGEGLSESLVKIYEQKLPNERKKRKERKKIENRIIKERENTQELPQESHNKYYSRSFEGSSENKLQQHKSLKKIELTFPTINEADCESDRFSEGKSDCESDDNDFNKKQYNNMTGSIMKVIQNFNSMIGGNFRKDFLITRKKKKMRHPTVLKNKSKRKIMTEEMKVVPSLRYRLLQKKVLSQSQENFCMKL